MSETSHQGMQEKEESCVKDSPKHPLHTDDSYMEIVVETVKPRPKILAEQKAHIMYE